jgi:type IV secretion system protein VirB6
MPSCAAPARGTGFVRGTLDYIDCQAQAIGEGGYQALASGSLLPAVLGGLLTLFVALVGYRMLVGEGVGVRQAVVAAAKVGIVLALATSWPAYRTLIYDVVLLGPAELASEITSPSGLPGADGGLVDRLQAADRMFLQLIEAGEAEAAAPAPPALPPQFAQQQTAEAQVAAQAQAQPPAAPVLRPGELALGGARVLYLAGAVGALAAVRLVAGLLLALGPLFAAFLLFDSTRGVFQGWLRALGGAALGALAVAVVLGVELALLEPRLAALLATREAGDPISGAPAELLAATSAFLLVLIAVLAAAAAVARGVSLPATWRQNSRERTVTIVEPRAPAATPATAAGFEPPAAARSRAQVVAQAVAGEAPRLAPAAQTTVIDRRTAPGFRNVGEEPVQIVPLGQSFPRRTRGRVSARADRRNRIA